MSVITSMMLLTDWPSSMANGGWLGFFFMLAMLGSFAAWGLWLCYKA